ncbi:hypothetical protein TNIN_227311 [Trichonephila inaurata madagascariensis]|uniref:Uncharacterized protein n=1 Tax=Trichonephila inaurata madagascariensis TaxID=2747483 RepID=A0A8X6WSB6_9ARAC|nr:hypothetical protein TNIN_227311 [Trichonephila inaurata madagascariensis]
MYDTEEDIWTEVDVLPQPTMGLSVTVIDDRKVWLVGGIISSETEQREKCFTPDVYTFIPTLKRWSKKPPLPVPHAFLSCAATRDSLWAVGGSHPLGNSYPLILNSCACVWTLDLRSHRQEWKHTSALSSPTHASSAVLCGNMFDS